MTAEIDLAAQPRRVLLAVAQMLPLARCVREREARAALDLAHMLIVRASSDPNVLFRGMALRAAAERWPRSIEVFRAVALALHRLDVDGVDFAVFDSVVLLARARVLVGHPDDRAELLVVRASIERAVVRPTVPSPVYERELCRRIQLKQLKPEQVADLVSCFWLCPGVKNSLRACLGAMDTVDGEWLHEFMVGLPPILRIDEVILPLLEDPMRRDFAVRVLASIGDATAVAPLRRLSRDLGSRKNLEVLMAVNAIQERIRRRLGSAGSGEVSVVVPNSNGGLSFADSGGEVSLSRAATTYAPANSEPLGGLTFDAERSTMGLLNRVISFCKRLFWRNMG